MADQIDVSQVVAQVEYEEPAWIDVSQVVAQVEYEEVGAGPTMARLMRHGTWFDYTGKKPFWWAR
jgi:hypothetical protein